MDRKGLDFWTVRIYVHRLNVSCKANFLSEITCNFLF